jgi:curli biogenesis system outer membrane secretion channel CsgG
MSSNIRIRRELCRAAFAIGMVVWCSDACSQVLPARRRVAVLNFEDYSGGSTGTPQAFGAGAAAAAKGVSAQLIEKLTHSEKYTVVDQFKVEKLLVEQNSSEPDGVDVYGRASRIGRMLGLDAMIVGAITRFGPEAVPKQAAGGHPGVSRRKSKAYVDITARILDMTTGQVIAEFTATGESAGTGGVTRIIGHGHSKEPQEMLGNEFVDSLLGEASRNAIEKIAGQLDSFAEKIPVLSIGMEGLVAEVAGNSLTLNIGKKSGIKVGDKLTVLREVREVTDPQTGQRLPPVVEPLGEATVTEVADDYATASFSGSAEVQVGDRVKAAATSAIPPQ